MSVRAPRRFRLTREQLGTKVPDWVQPLLAQLNAFNEETVSAFEQMNGAEVTKEVVIQTGTDISNSFPLTFKHGLSAAPKSVQLGQIFYLDGTTPTNSPAITTWSATGDAVTIGRINNLGVNAKIRLTFKIS